MMAINEARPRQHSFSVGRGFFSWMMQRLTGLVLAVCLVVHVISTHLMRVGHIDAGFVRKRLGQEPIMTTFYTVFIAALVYHACNGLWAIILDFNPGRMTRQLVGALLIVGGAALISFGYVVLQSLSKI